jgi:hypothetical protein
MFDDYEIQESLLDGGFSCETTEETNEIKNRNRNTMSSLKRNGRQKSLLLGWSMAS